MTKTPDDFDLGLLDGRVFTHGTHTNPAEGMCALEAASILLGEEFTDEPSVVPLTLVTYVSRLNDAEAWESNEQRTAMLKPLLPRLLCVESSYGWTVRCLGLHLAFLRGKFLAELNSLGFTDAATEIRDVGEVIDIPSAHRLSEAYKHAQYAVDRVYYPLSETAAEQLAHERIYRAGRLARVLTDAVRVWADGVTFTRVHGFDASAMTHARRTRVVDAIHACNVVAPVLTSPEPMRERDDAVALLAQLIDARPEDLLSQPWESVNIDDLDNV